MPRISCRPLGDAVELETLVELTKIAKALRVPRAVVTRKLLSFVVKHAYPGDFVLNAGQWVYWPATEGKITIGRPGRKKLDECGNQPGVKLGAIEVDPVKRRRRVKR
jgi:hypothetical protein